MQYARSPRRNRDGITVLTLLLLIIAAIIAAIFLVRYFRTRPSLTRAAQATVLPAADYRISRLIS